MVDLKPHEKQAILFLAEGPDNLGIIYNEDEMAAGLVYGFLMGLGLVDASGSGEGWTAFLTTEGADLAAELREAG